MKKMGYIGILLNSGMSMSLIFSAAASSLTASTPFAEPAEEMIWDSTNGHALSLNDFIRSVVAPGEIVVLGEQHATLDNQDDPSVILHHSNQLRLLQRLAAEFNQNKVEPTSPIDTAMEFFTYTMQGDVNRFLSGELNETDFLRTAQWGQNPFALYREQVLAPRLSGGRTVALNIPASIAAHVAKSGRDSLTEAERGLLPPIWERGRDDYFARFQEVMAGHATDAQLEKFFWAQSLWDDTMAWNAWKNQMRFPQARTVIIVGEFHVEFRQGLPSRLARHGANRIVTLLQVEVPDLSPSTLIKATAPDPKWGPRSDYLWLYKLDAKAEDIKRWRRLMDSGLAFNRRGDAAKLPPLVQKFTTLLERN